MSDFKWPMTEIMVPTADGPKSVWLRKAPASIIKSDIFEAKDDADTRHNVMLAAKLCSYVLCDENGKQLYPEERFDELLEWPLDVLLDVADRVKDVCVIEVDVKEKAKNSPTRRRAKRRTR